MSRSSLASVAFQQDDTDESGTDAASDSSESESDASVDSAHQSKHRMSVFVGAKRRRDGVPASLPKGSNTTSEASRIWRAAVRAREAQTGKARRLGILSSKHRGVSCT